MRIEVAITMASFLVQPLYLSMRGHEMTGKFLVSGFAFFTGVERV